MAGNNDVQKGTPVRSTRFTLLLPTLIGMTLFFACSSGDPDETPSEGATGGAGGTEPMGESECAELAEAAGWREGEPVELVASSTPERITAMGAPTWDLALRMMEVVPTSEIANIANSPTSMFVAMGMNYARYEEGECGHRIVEVMRYPETGVDLHNTLGATVSELASRAGDKLTLSMAQSIWALGTDELPEPTELQSLYGARMNALESQGDAARDVINCIVEEQSSGLLVDFLPESQPQPDTVSYDLNVAYLEAAWADHMSPMPLTFTGESTAAADVPAFGADVTMQTFDGDDFQAASVPLVGGELSVLFVLPNDGVSSLSDFTNDLSPAELEAARLEGTSALLDFRMPVLKAEAKTLDYNQDRLDFACPPFTLRAIFHAAAVEFDEKGVKAAAATAAETWEDGGPPAPSGEFHLNRPFLYFIYDEATDFVLFSGRYLGVE